MLIFGHPVFILLLRSYFDLNWNTEQALSFATDPAAASRAQGIAKTSKWDTFSQSPNAIWGACKSSGSKNYSVAVDLSGPAFKCSCPSRKFPCKHSLGLLLLFASNNEFPQGSEPEWVNEWLQKRQASKTPAKTVVNTEKKDQAKADRIQKMQDGLHDLNEWLRDIFRQGIASLEGADEQFFEGIAASLVDAKVPGIARIVKEIPEIIQTENNWPELVYEKMGMLRSLCCAFQKHEELSPSLQLTIETIGGINIKKDSLSRENNFIEDWFVLGIEEELMEEQRGLYVRRVWLFGISSGKYALIIDFSQGGLQFQDHFLTGSLMRAELVYYPAAVPLRAMVIKRQPTDTPDFQFEGYQAFQIFLEDYLEALKKNPWLGQFPGFFQSVKPFFKNKNFYLADQKNQYIPLKCSSLVGYKLLALSEGKAISLFGIWVNNKLIPLSVLSTNQIKML